MEVFKGVWNRIYLGIHSYISEDKQKKKSFRRRVEKEVGHISPPWNPPGNIAFFTLLVKRLTANGVDISAISTSKHNNNNVDNTDSLGRAPLQTTATTGALHTPETYLLFFLLSLLVHYWEIKHRSGIIICNDTRKMSRRPQTQITWETETASVFLQKLTCYIKL